MILQDDPDAIPRVTRDLLDHLDRIYPADAWKSAANYDELSRLQGAHEIIDLLKRLHSDQNGEPNVLLDIDPGATATGPATGDT